MAKPENPHARIYARFLRKTADHRCSIGFDDGVHRRLLTAHPDDVGKGWDLVTWPGCLALAGADGQGYLFAHAPDALEMFDLPDSDRNYYSDGGPRIDFRHWHDALLRDRSLGDVRQYDGRLLHLHVSAFLDRHDELAPGAIATIRATDPAEADRRSAARARILDWTTNTRFAGETAAHNWLQDPEQREIFDKHPTHEWDLCTYPKSFLIACYRIDLAVRLYREAQARAQIGRVVDFAEQRIGQELRRIRDHEYTSEEAATVKARITDVRAGIDLLTAKPLGTTRGAACANDATACAHGSQSGSRQEHRLAEE